MKGGLDYFQNNGFIFKKAESFSDDAYSALSVFERLL
jgi:hypothetical protein